MTSVSTKSTISRSKHTLIPIKTNCLNRSGVTTNGRRLGLDSHKDLKRKKQQNSQTRLVVTETDMARKLLLLLHPGLNRITGAKLLCAGLIFLNEMIIVAANLQDKKSATKMKWNQITAAELSFVRTVPDDSGRICYRARENFIMEQINWVWLSETERTLEV